MSDHLVRIADITEEIKASEQKIQELRDNRARLFLEMRYELTYDAMGAYAGISHSQVAREILRIEAKLALEERKKPLGIPLEDFQAALDAYNAEQAKSDEKQ